MTVAEMNVKEFSKKNKDYFLKHSKIKYGKFRVLSMDSVTNKGNLIVSVLCDCGVECKVSLALIVSGRTKCCKECQKLVLGVAINDADYSVTKIVDGVKVPCPYHTTWSNLVSRCYNEKLKLKYPTYQDCTICEEWLIFSNFKAWMEAQDWQGNYLDKDLLVKGNKIYSPDTCLFVSRYVNNILVAPILSDKTLPTGVSIATRYPLKYRARCSDGTKTRTLGKFDTWQEAEKVYKSFKYNVLLQAAMNESNPKVKAALIERAEDYKNDSL